ncbi:Putative serine protease HtrA [Rosistilla ulvae]|uniref:Serine protease HtrA n=1 Tax=Rosistilla ulvae TaxID=1930277 RepID=A0A517M8L8_9BACT|nr:serine protease [Rosistilla ulvae]QDS91228.1 Putative serine protease HtrA [Rosistilla ulvae]
MKKTSWKKNLVLMSLAALMSTSTTSANEEAGKPVSLPVHADQALAALQPGSGPIDLNAKPIPKGLGALLGQASRGPAASVFPKIAPSVVVVRAGGGYGTGFIVDADGWILTNNHVIESAGIDINTASRMAYIHFGDLEDGMMTLNQQATPALVYAASPEKDLAILKLLAVPEGRELKPIVFATKNATPGTDCITIGHPKRGVFWAVRSGEVVGIAKYPHDMIDTVMTQMVMASDAKQSFANALSQSRPRKALLSTCGINPGDSGGPLLNNDGELVAVNFAIPKSEKDSQVNLDKFSYHVHLDEVKEFTANRPEKSEVFQPNYWPPAATSDFLDVDDDDVYETWRFSIDDETPFTGVVVDLDSDTPANFIEDYKAGKQDRKQFECEFALAVIPNNRVFYDRDNDGEFDLILTDVDENGTSDLTIAKTINGWERLELNEQPMFDPTVFRDAKLQERFKVLMMTQAKKPEGTTPDAESPEEKKPETETPPAEPDPAEAGDSKK